MYSYGPPCLWRAIYFEIEGNGRRFTPGGVSATLLVFDHPRPPQQVPAAATLKFQTNTKMAGSDPDMYCPIFQRSSGNKGSGKCDAHVNAVRACCGQHTRQDLLYPSRSFYFQMLQVSTCFGKQNRASHLTVCFHASRDSGFRG